MSCDICGRGNCTPIYHNRKEQQQFKPVIEAFEYARELRRKLHQALDAAAAKEEEELYDLQN